jgi:ankyrin repeat protein
LLVSRGANVNVQDEDGFTALRQAVGDNHPDLVSLLIKSGAELDSRAHADGNGTPLHTACAYGHTECTRVLVYHAANAGLKDDEGRIAADYARMYGHSELAEMIDSRSAQPGDESGER